MIKSVHMPISPIGGPPRYGDSFRVNYPDPDSMVPDLTDFSPLNVLRIGIFTMHKMLKVTVEIEQYETPSQDTTDLIAKCGAFLEEAQKRAEGQNDIFHRTLRKIGGMITHTDDLLKARKAALTNLATKMVPLGTTICFLLMEDGREWVRDKAGAAMQAIQTMYVNKHGNAEAPSDKEVNSTQFSNFRAQIDDLFSTVY